MSLILHCGAGNYANPHSDVDFEILLRNALKIGLNMLQNDEIEAQDVACAVVAILEASPLTNAAFGSNLTRNGTVECDATVAFIRKDEDDPCIASIGAVCGIDSPAQAALALCREADDGLLTTTKYFSVITKKWL